MGSQKKRHASKSPTRRAITKRLRRASSSTVGRSLQNDETSQRYAFRGESDPYKPGDGSKMGALSYASKDWNFRIKVLSSMTKLDHDVVQEAVQDLVKMRFPQDIIKNLGVNTIKEHMEAENAPFGNIEKVVEIFDTEMVHKITWMLAQYLDTSAKVKVGVKSLIAACNNLHDLGLSPNLFDKVIANLSEYNACSVDDANADEAQLASQHERRLDKATKGSSKKKHDLKHDRFASTINTNASLRHYSKDADKPVQSIENGKTLSIQDTSVKDRKISKSWCWDIDLNDYDYGSVTNNFRRTANLFAYHALPIVQTMLGASLTRRDTRLEMQKMLDSMPESEYTKWVENLQKLYDGDKTMLMRPSQTSIDATRNIATATPAPIDIRKISKKNSVTQTHNDQPDGEANRTAHEVVRPEPHVKLEVPVDLDLPEACSVQGTRRATCEPSEATENRHQSPFEGARHEDLHDERVTDREVYDRSEVQRHNSNARKWGRHETYKKTLYDLFFTVPGLKTPVIDLLWGQMPFSVADAGIVIGTLIESLEHRVKAKPRSFIRLNRKILAARCKRYQDARLTCRILIEHELQIWVLAHFEYFPELKQEAFVFTRRRPHNTAVLDLFATQGMNLALSDQSSRAFIIEQLVNRGLSLNSQLVRYADNLIRDMLENPNYREGDRRYRVEKALRLVALSNKSKFRDLTNSPIVVAWEQVTGLRW